MKVVILCAGRGSRLGKMTECIPKAMLTINRKPVIGYILDHIYNACSFKEEPEVGIAVGYKHELIESYVSDFYADRQISFVRIDKFQGKGSGPGLTLLHMKEFVAGEPFILILGDTLCFDDLAYFLDDVNTIGIYRVDDSARFTTCEVDEDNFIRGFYDKVEKAPSDLAIIGIYYIKDSDCYFKGLEITRDNLIADELQISNGLNYLIEKGKPVRALYASWLDAGVEETLQSTRFCLGDFDTVYKNNTLTIIQDGHIRKYGCDKTFDELIRYYGQINALPAKKLYDEIVGLSDQYPKFFDFKYSNDQKLAIILLQGLVDVPEAIRITNNLVLSLKKYLYTPEREIVNPDDILYEYKDKILMALRADEAMEKFMEVPYIHLNESLLRNPIKILEGFDVAQFVPSTYVPVHGKLYLGNILYNLERDDFKLIYPKKSFGSSFIFGDLTSDIAMLRQCFNGCYNMIKADRFKLNYRAEYDFAYQINSNNIMEAINGVFDGMLLEIFADPQMLDRARALEGILFLQNISEVSKYEQKMAFYLTAANLMNEFFAER